jgi:hypothetical protein
MTPDERLRELCAQVLRCEHPEVIDSVAEQLQLALKEYLQARSPEIPGMGVTPDPATPLN